MPDPFRPGDALRAALSACLVLTLICTASPAASAVFSSRRIERLLSWGAVASGADGAYRRGATGDGVVVAMIDTGVDPSAGRMFSNLSPASIDLVPDRQHDLGDRRHGEQTASLLAARRDGQGAFGIAYGATLLSIRADRDGSCLKICGFEPVLLARAIDYAVEHGAKVIGMPLAAKRRLPEIEPALERAVASGALIVAAAGNDGAAEPYWPARYAADARFAGSMIVTGASTRAGQLARWSNRAGVAQNRFLAAPGEQVVVDCAERYCRLTSGTSYSVAYVAGAAALLMSRDPALAGPAAAEALLDSARDLADRGVDAATGRGLLDVSRALSRVEHAERAE